MNRREVITGAMALGASMPGAAQMGGMFVPAIPTDADARKREYAICKSRGHSLIFGPMGAEVVAATFTGERGPQMICKYCGTTVWTETIEHEEGAPE